MRTPRNEVFLLTEWLDRTPPFWCYFLACNRGMDRYQIAKAAGISWRSVTRLGVQITWSRVKVEVMQKFCIACGVTPWKLLRKNYFYLWQIQKGRMKKPFAHLSPLQRRTLDICSRRWMAAHPKS